jgi:alanyl-tRNA synthetase
MDKNKIYDNIGFFIVHGKEHIEQAHDFLVNVMKINQDLIYTVFDKDDENDSKHRD